MTLSEATSSLASGPKVHPGGFGPRPRPSRSPLSLSRSKSRRAKFPSNRPFLFMRRRPLQPAPISHFYWHSRVSTTTTPPQRNPIYPSFSSSTPIPSPPLLLPVSSLLN